MDEGLRDHENRITRIEAEHELVTTKKLDLLIGRANQAEERHQQYESDKVQLERRIESLEAKIANLTPKPPADEKAAS